MAGTVPLVLPRTEFVYEAVFDLAPTMNLGNSPLGERRMVPITSHPVLWTIGSAMRRA